MITFANKAHFPNVYFSQNSKFYVLVAILHLSDLEKKYAMTSKYFALLKCQHHTHIFETKRLYSPYVGLQQCPLF